MNRYQLAKLVQWAGKLHTRKRLQKVVFLLQAKGCPFNAEYTLHHYGPYSQEVARLSAVMVEVNLLEEKAEENQFGQQYSYKLSATTREELAELERTPKGKKMAAQLSPFEAQAKELLGIDVRRLEVASTMVYFRKQGHSWTEAVQRTCKFKDLPANDEAVKRAEVLARQFVA